MGERRSARRGGRMLLVLLALLLAGALPVTGGATAAQVLVPVGGGYTTETLEGFARVAAEHGNGPTLDILVVPAAYGDAPADRKENITLAQERTSQIEAACDAVVAAPGDGYDDCTATLLLLFDRADALNPDNSAAFEDEETDAAFILGGDQTIAMHVLAGTVAEERMAAAYARGVVFGGTSAGAAVESRDMIAGYTADGWPYNALERPMVDVWWYDGAGDVDRGLAFGSDDVIFDQHFFERGRFGRLLNVVAQSDEREGGASRLGAGIDWGTALTLDSDGRISSVFGASAVAVIDFETLGATHAWHGTRQTLSARNVLTHIIAPGDVTYDVASRDVLIGGVALASPAPGGWSLAAPAGATLYLGGDLAGDLAGPALQAFAADVTAAGSESVLVVAAGYRSNGSAKKAAGDYASALAAALGPNVAVERVVHGSSAWSKLLASGARHDAVVVVGGDAALLDTALADPAFVAFVEAAIQDADVVLADGAMTAALGQSYVANPDPTDADSQDQAIASFQAGWADIQPGLGIVAVDLETALTYDQRWGRLYALARQGHVALGIAELTAIRLDNSGATVAGERSVIALDGRDAETGTGSNGAFRALNVVLDAFAPGDTVLATR